MDQLMRGKLDYIEDWMKVLELPDMTLRKRVDRFEPRTFPIRGML